MGTPHEDLRRNYKPQKPEPCRPDRNTLAQKQVLGADPMGIDTERDIEANLQIGPTDQAMVRIFVSTGSVEIPMDFTADEAEEIADEIRAAAATVRQTKPKKR